MTAPRGHGDRHTDSLRARMMGTMIDSGSLGDTERTSTATLAVNEAQAINSRAGG